MKMQCIRQCIQRFASNSVFAANNTNCLSGILKPLHAISSSNIHGSSALADADPNKKPSKFLSENDIVFPPQKPGEERRPAFVCHMKSNIKYSPLKMWYIACFVRGMTVDEAVKQLSFLHKKGAAIAKQVILEAQQLAVEEHNVEFKSNLWVAESFSTKGMVIKGIRRHAKGRGGRVHYKYCNYFVRLEEGQPPKNYYMPVPQTGEEMLEEWMQNMRNRKVHGSL
ncbi:mitochondrial ribosomal protein L22 isoform X2 [Calliopsis andreniformis]|uniref:mitochondrial ribosomal protein L22 isoform X2 n=1 Tax=Calliopsis andreniformis TaxID=337506 RepID=UPI003FCDFE38